MGGAPEDQKYVTYLDIMFGGDNNWETPSIYQQRVITLPLQMTGAYINPTFYTASD